MIQNGDLVRIMEGVHQDKLGLVIKMPHSNVARLKILDYLMDNDYVAYNTDSLEKKL